jgi:hypothetical protein
MPVFTLSRREWREFKTANGLTKSPVFKKADVGPSLVRLQKALKKWDSDQGEKAFGEVLVEANKVKKAFGKFIKVKGELGELSKDAERQIKTWEGELNNAVEFLKGVYRSNPEKLKDKDVKNMYSTFGELGL